jgi:phospholipid/cholesterol/gamma-HCH transport system substrate-binding protein
MSTPFRERNPVVVGAISLAVVAAFILAAFNAQNLPIIGGGDVYYAAFKEAGGLKANDEVRVAGVRVGKVEKVELDGDHVKVTFRVEDPAAFGTETRADIKVKTLLGAMFLALEPAGSGQLPEGAEIPVERTSSPYDVVKAFSGLAQTSDRIDTDQLAAALTTLADLTRNTPEEFRTALDGVSRLSTNIAAKNGQINTLLGNLQKVSEVLDARDQDIVGLMRDSDVLFRALVKRRAAVHRLLVSTSTLSTELTRLVRQSRADRTHPPRDRRRRAEQERGQHRQQPAPDGAVLPRLREHAGQRAVVRHLHPEHAPRPAGGLTWT